jgi:hypothetical protein
MNNTTSRPYFLPIANGNKTITISYFTMSDLLFREQRHERSAISQAAKTNLFFLSINDRLPIRRKAAQYGSYGPDSMATKNVSYDPN